MSLIMNRIDRPPPTSDPAGPHQFDWQWSKGQDVKSKSVSTTHQEPDSAAPGNDSGESSTEPAWQYSEISRSGDGAPTVASDPSSEQRDVERDIAELAQGTKRIKRRGASNGSSDEVENTDTVRSPWSLRNRGA